MPKFKIDRSLFPFESRYLDLEDGTRIHYVDEGKGPVLLLLHGNPAWSFLYRKLIPLLSGSYRCIAPDLPGFGLSTAPQGYGSLPEEHTERMQQLVEALDLKNITIFTQDWAGPIGFGIAVAQPQRIAGFIIGNTFAWPLRKPVFRVFSFLMGSFPGPMIAHSFNGIVKFFFRRGIRKHALNKAEWNMYLAPFKTVESRAPTHIFPKALAHSSIFLSELENKMSILSEKPALFVWGNKDFAFGPDERKRLMKSFPLNQVVHLKGAGHFIQEDAPEEIASAIHGWFRNK